MFTAAFGRILWKEYRVNRALWLSLLVIGCLFQLSLWWFVLQTETRDDALQYVCIMFPVMHAIGCGGLLFAGEREERTSDWLLSLSAPSSPMLLAKAGFGAVSTIVLQLLMSGLTLILLRHTPSIMYLLALFPLIVLIWSSLGSLVCRRVLSSVPVMAFTAFVAHFVLLCWLVPWTWGRDSQEASRMMQRALTAFSTCALAVDIWLGWRWCHGKYLDGATIAEAVSRWMGSHNSISRPRLARSHVMVQAEHEQSWRRTWQRLVWQERHRESAYRIIFYMAIGFGILFTILQLALSDELRKQEITYAFLALLIPIPLAMGILGFRSDAGFQQPRFLALRGLSPVSVWLAKQAVWLPRALLLPFGLFLVAIVIPNLSWRSSSNHPSYSSVAGVYLLRPDLMIWVALMGYACGQLAAILHRRTILAAAFSVLLLCGFLAWLGMLYSMNVPLWWSQGVPIVAMLLITLWQTKAWMLERHSWSRQAKLILVLIAVPVAMIGLLAQFRIREAHATTPTDFNLQQQLQFAIQSLPGASDTDEHLRQLDQLSLSSKTQLPTLVDEIISLLKSSSVSFPPKRFGEEPVNKTAVGLQRILSKGADDYLHEGSIDKALECHLANLRLASLVGDGEVAQWLSASSMVRTTLSEMVVWANHPMQTPASIYGAIMHVEEKLSQFPSATQGIARSYQGDRRTWILSSKNELVENLMQLRRLEQPAFEWQVLPMLTPWEQKRAEILMTRNAEINFAAIWSLENRLKTPTYSANNTEMRGFTLIAQANGRLIQTTPLVRLTHMQLEPFFYAVLNHHTHLRASITRMALLAYRLKEGRLPERLVQLMESIDGMYLVDPWADRLFDYYPSFLISRGNINVAVMPVTPTDFELVYNGQNNGQYRGVVRVNFHQISLESLVTTNQLLDGPTSTCVFLIPNLSREIE